MFNGVEHMATPYVVLEEPVIKEWRTVVQRRPLNKPTLDVNWPSTAYVGEEYRFEVYVSNPNDVPIWYILDFEFTHGPGYVQIGGRYGQVLHPGESMMLAQGTIGARKKEKVYVNTVMFSTEGEYRGRFILRWGPYGGGGGVRPTSVLEVPFKITVPNKRLLLVLSGVALGGLAYIIYKVFKR